MDYTKGRNLYVILNETPGYLNYLGTYISTQGAPSECTSDWISVEGIESVTIQSWVPEIGDNQQTWIGYAFYSDKSLSENVSSRTAKYGAAGSDYLVYKGVSVPDGAKYLRVSYRHFNDGKCKVEIGNEATDWRPAPEDAQMFGGGGWSFMILARNSITLSHVRDITAVTWYYKLQASTASPPAKPTTATPSGWTTTEPTYTEGSTNSLYTVQKTTFSDGTFEYSDVSLSSSYEASKAAYNKSVAALEAATPIETKTYSGLIGSANDAANASFYFAKIHPTDYTVQWRVSLRIRVTAPASYMQSVIIQFGGYGSTFSSFDSYTVRNSNLGMYFVNLYRATSAGITTNHKGHALGIGLRSSTQPTTAAQARTIKVELLEVENCTVAFTDAAVKYASIDGTGSTNYTGLTEMSVATAGQNATNNANTHYQQHGNAVKTGTNGVRSYSLIMKDTDSTWSSLYGSAYNGTGTGKTVCTTGFILDSILYSAGAPSGGNYAAGSNTSTVYDGYPIDFRYSSNCATTLTAYKPVYIVGEIHSDGLFYLDQTWWTQTVPTTEDGKTYVYVGDAYSSYHVWLSVENKAYQYYDGKFMTLEEVKTAEKRRVFTSEPEPPYDIGDLWVEGENGDIKICTIAKNSSGSFSDADWSLASKYTDNTAVEALETVVDSISTVVTDADRAAQEALDAATQIRTDLAVVQETDEGVRNWMTFDQEETGGQTFPVLRLGTDSSAVYAVFTNSRLEFRVQGNDDPVAYIAADESGVGKLYATNSVVVNEMQFGDWAWYQRPNGNMSIRWTGGDE